MHCISQIFKTKNLTSVHLLIHPLYFINFWSWKHNIQSIYLRMDPSTHCASFKKIHPFLGSLVYSLFKFVPFHSLFEFLELFISNSYFLSGDTVLENLELTIHVIIFHQITGMSHFTTRLCSWKTSRKSNTKFPLRKCTSWGVKGLTTSS
jgi:hypothetical protein